MENNIKDNKSICFGGVTMEKNTPQEKATKVLTKKNIKSLVNGILFGFVLAVGCIFNFIAFIFDMEFLFDVFNIGKNKKKK